jgi:MFS family permease
MEQGMINPAFQFPELTPFFWIGTIFGPNPTQFYGILIGPAFIVPLIISSFVAGPISERFSRKTVMSLAVIIWSATILVTGFANEMYLVLVMRIVLGFTIGFFVPPAISLIVDYFPANRQTTAMGLFALAESLSDGLTSFATVVIASVGWRKTYIMFGTIFMGIGLVGLTAIKEPVRQRFTYINK